MCGHEEDGAGVEALRVMRGERNIGNCNTWGQVYDIIDNYLSRAIPHMEILDFERRRSIGDPTSWYVTISDGSSMATFTVLS